MTEDAKTDEILDFLGAESGGEERTRRVFAGPTPRRHYSRRERASKRARAILRYARQTIDGMAATAARMPNMPQVERDRAATWARAQRRALMPRPPQVREGKVPRHWRRMWKRVGRTLAEDIRQAV